MDGFISREHMDVRSDLAMDGFISREHKDVRSDIGTTRVCDVLTMLLHPQGMECPDQYPAHLLSSTGCQHEPTHPHGSGS